MSTLRLNIDGRPGFLGLFAVSPGATTHLPITGTVNSLIQEPAELLPPLESGVNGEPPWAYGPSTSNTEPFDYRKLPRLQTSPSQQLVMSNANPSFVIETANGLLDLSDMFASGDWSRPISGLAEGKATFILRTNQSPLGISGVTSKLQDIRKISAGDLFEWSNSWANGTFLVGRGYVLKPPTIHVNSSSFTEINLELGDELALFSNSSRLAQKLYCGRPPQTSQEAAKIYAEVNGLFTRTFPPGHSLADQSNQTFTDESPFQYLQALYRPTNQDVRCSNQSRAIQVIPRQPFDAAQATTLNYRQTLEFDPTIAMAYEPFNSLKVFNNFEVVSAQQRRTQTYKTVSGQKTNKKPWFQGGYTETTTTETTQGDTLIFSKSVTKGYIPMEDVVAEADYNEDPCNGIPIATKFATINTKTFSLSYEEHASGAYLVNKSETWEKGLKLIKITAENISKYAGLTNTQGNPAAIGDYAIYGRPGVPPNKNILKYSKEEYMHTPQINPEVCEKDYIHLETSRRTDTYGLVSDDTYKRLETAIDFYQVSGEAPSGQSYIGTGLSWEKTEKRAAYDEEARAYITQPPRIIPNTNPPASKWIRPRLDRVTAFTTVTNSLVPLNGRLYQDRPEPLQADFCYTLEELETYGSRALQENNGLALARELAVPYYKKFELGQSVIYTDQNGQTNNYLVFAIQVSQNGPSLTKYLTLAQVT